MSDTISNKYYKNRSYDRLNARDISVILDRSEEKTARAFSTLFAWIEKVELRFQSLEARLGAELSLSAVETNRTIEMGKVPMELDDEVSASPLNEESCSTGPRQGGPSDQTPDNILDAEPARLRLPKTTSVRNRQTADRDWKQVWQQIDTSASH
jgi:hypothetical protein